MASILEVSSSLRLPALAARVGTQTGKVNTVSVQNAVPAYTKLSMVVKAAGDDEVTSRRAICLVATTIAAGVLAGNASALSNIQLAGPGKPSGGLPGTDSPDEARDLDLPLKQRFYLQLKTPEDALVRIKEAADVLKSDTKKELQKKAWPYIRNSLRLSVLYLRLDISTCIASKPKAEKKALTAEAKKLNDAIEAFDYAARQKNFANAEKSYASTLSLLDDLIVKLA